jgi:hypothetical protein
MLDVPAGVDVDLVPREVRVPEHDEVARGEPPAEPTGPAGGGPAVVDDPEAAAADIHLDALGQVDTVVVVALDGEDPGRRHPVPEGLEHRDVDDVTGVDHGVDASEVLVDLRQQSIGLTGAEVGVRDEQEVRAAPTSPAAACCPIRVLRARECFLRGPPAPSTRTHEPLGWPSAGRAGSGGQPGGGTLVDGTGVDEAGPVVVVVVVAA